MSFSEQHYHHQVVAFTLENGCLSDLEAVPIPLRTALHRIPAEPASPAEVLLSLSNLPLAEEGADRSLWPYLEVQVLLTEPDPGFRHRVEEALADKAVRLSEKGGRGRFSSFLLYGFTKDRSAGYASPYLYEPFRGRFAGRVGKDV